MDLNQFLRYWSLTLAVFVFYLFAMLIAAMDIFDELSEAARKRRASAKTPALDPNPLANRAVAQTLLPGPGQRLDDKRQWVANLAREVVGRVGAGQTVKILVLEDSKAHPLVHFNDGKKVESYRVDRTIVEAAMAGSAEKAGEIKDLLTRHLKADFLGQESERPPRTTELAREAGAKSGAAPASPAAQPTAPAAETAPAPAAAGPAPEQMSREERLAAARAKAEALKKARQAQNSKDQG